MSEVPLYYSQAVPFDLEFLKIEKWRPQCAPLTLTLGGRPSTRSPQPSILNPQPSTFNPQLVSKATATEHLEILVNGGGVSI